VHPVVNVFLLSLVAGLATGLGGLLAIVRKPGELLFGFLMGFASGVMISLSFLELVNHAWEQSGYLVATAGFGAGALFMFAIDFLTPHIRFDVTEDRSIAASANELDTCRQGRRHRRRRSAEHVDQRLLHSGLLIAIGITIHNIPEGIAVGAGFMAQPRFGALVALAVALHNIPEGIATALPLCQGGLCKRDSFLTALLSGLVEPLGAVLAATVLSPLRSLVPAALAFAGGVMVFITLDELVPAAREHGHHHSTALGIILGSVLFFLLSGIFGM
jgi:ZIP family zinc transporter